MAKREYTLDDFRKIFNKLTGSSDIFRKNFDDLYDLLYEIGIEYYKSFDDFMAEHRDSYTLDVLLTSLQEFPNDNKPLAKGDTDCYCYTYNEFVHSFDNEDDAIESIRKLVIKKRPIDYLSNKGYEEDSIKSIMKNVLKESVRNGTVRFAR